MTEQSDNANKVSLQPNMKMDINKQMQARERRRNSNIDFSQIKKMQPLSFLVVRDPTINSRVFALVDFDGMGFIFFEESIKGIPSEKGVNIAQRILIDLYEINKISKLEVGTLMQDKDLGAVYLKLHEKIAEISRKNYGVEVDSTLTTLNAMLILNLVTSENPEAEDTDHCRALAREVTDDVIEKTAWFALRKREARYMIEREILASRM